MAFVYCYCNTRYSTEAEAQSAADDLKVRMQNNPTDWMEAKELLGSNEGGWVITDSVLTDAEILSPDSSKTYSCYSQYDGENYIGLTSSELTSKVDFLRIKYGDFYSVATILKVDDSTETFTEIDTTTDMSNYVSTEA